MKVRCIYNKGEDLKAYEKKQLSNSYELGKFGATFQTDFGLTIGNEYLVMGMIMGEGVLNYLIDDCGYIFSNPSPLFEVVQNEIPENWFFKSFKKTDDNYPYIEAVWGYQELVFDNNHYQKLVEGNQEAEIIYFKQKLELEKLF